MFRAWSVVRFEREKERERERECERESERERETSGGAYDCDQDHALWQSVRIKLAGFCT